MYCSPSDLYLYGLPRGGLPNPARLVERISSISDGFTLDQHGFSDGDVVTFRAEAGGTLPEPLTEDTQYFAIRESDNVFQVSATESGATVDLTTSGEGVLVFSELPIGAAIAWASAIVDDMLPAHVVPLEAPYSPIVVMTTAELAVGKLTALQGVDPETLRSTVDAAQTRLSRWAKGVPVRGTNAPTRHNLAASAAVSYRDARGWRSDETV